MSKLLLELQERKILKQITNREKIEFCEKNNCAVYCGFDPTADSLHIGHMVQIINLLRFQQFGFKPIALVGGATGMIGDPSFKSSERVLLTNEEVEKNINAIKKQLQKIISNIEIVNNYNWYKNMNVLDFLRDTGKHFNIAYLLSKENIATRINLGLSVTEFMYTLLQAYDFYQLYKNKQCYLQIGGSDQWGNIVSGIDLINSKLKHQPNHAAGLTFKLVTKKNGQKFGKSESGTLWLDRDKTSEYELYQYLINQSDEDCENLLLSLTTLPIKKIYKIIQDHKKEPYKRLGQKALADNVVILVHGIKGLEKAKKITNAFFNSSIKELTNSEIKDLIKNFKIINVEKNYNIVSILITCNIASSKREARELIANKSIRINDELITIDRTITQEDAIFDKLVFIKKGKKNYWLIKLAEVE